MNATATTPVATRHVLVAFDFSPAAERALAWAARTARESAAAVTLFHVVYAPRGTGMGFDLVPPAGALTAGEHHALEAKLADAARRYGLPGARVEIVSAPNIGHAVIDAAERHGCDLIAMGTHGAGALTRAVVGSAATHVIRHATCPVITVRAAD